MLVRLILIAFHSLITVTACANELHTLETFTCTFVGPDTSEAADINPFTDYRLLVTFQSGDQSVQVRGFYAADGNAANSGAESGNVWKCRFATDVPGAWTYHAELRRGDWIAITNDPAEGQAVKLASPDGAFQVQPWPPAENQIDFRRRGRLTTEGHYFRFVGNGDYWIKSGANSPENLLAYQDFDGTYRIQANLREGEAKPNLELHRFDPHAQDWRRGDPTWDNQRGKNLIGGLNYLSDIGVNAIYFLTMNVGGDGNDVWPFASPDDPTRFDCSKLDQWDIVFEHAQRMGLLLHVITQETENEKWLDDGETGKTRQLYYRELIARFAHHPAIVWNLGEENGPANFSPNGQSTAQQTAMADFFATHDPYHHPVAIHSHASSDAQTAVLEPLLGYRSLDGVSLQVGKPARVHGDVLRWRAASSRAHHPWVITMDEIGPARRGAVPDAIDSGHDELRGPVLWGSLLAGAGGNEWYFGYDFPGNDLNCEDWRSRQELWRQTKIARNFFQKHLKYWDMQATDETLTGGRSYCFAELGQTYVIYRAAGQPAADLILDLSAFSGKFRVQWFDPVAGGDLQLGSREWIVGGIPTSVGMPPSMPQRDWVGLVRSTTHVSIRKPLP